MRYPRWFRLLLAALVLQLSTVEPLWAQGELSFTRQDFGVGGSRAPDDTSRDAPSSVTVGDFNGDGRQDLATANRFSDRVSILLGNGDGTFDPAQSFFVEGSAPTSMTVGDFNGDRQQDLAVANFFSTVSILLGQGDGTFPSAQVVDMQGGFPQSIAVGEFNGDGHQDLVTAIDEEDDPARVAILGGQGDGTFPFGGGGLVVGNGTSVTVGDFNGDGRQDVVVGNRTILLQGNGGFQAAPDLGVGPLPASFTVGDFNGDSQQDLAVANPFFNTVSILLGNGDGTFQDGRDFAAGPLPVSVTVGDFNGDSQQDLATANIFDDGDQTSSLRGSVSILLGNGDGTFEPTQDFEVGARSSSVTVGDFNGDGRQDVATANSAADTVSVLINIASVEITTYRLTRIGDEVTCAPGVSSCFPTITDMDDGAAMVGTTKSLGGEPPHAILLRGEVVIELGDLMGVATPDAGATAINDHTQITGTNQIQDASGNLVRRGFLFIFDFGRIGDLGVDGEVTPLDINTRPELDNRPQPQIVGQVVAGNVGMPFLWDAGRTTILPTLVCEGNPGGIARAINNSGVIVGTSNSRVGRRAVIWQDGASGGIRILEPPFPLRVGEAIDINNRGEVIGFYGGRLMGTALLWQADEVTVLPPLDHPAAIGAIPASINDQGQIVGHTHFGSGQSLATLWQDGGAALDLNELVSDDDPAKAFVTLTSAVVINDYGLIVVLGEDSRVPVGQEGREAHYLLTPTGIPASSSAVPSLSASSPPASDNNGGGAVDRVSLLLLVLTLFSVGACVRRRQRAVLVARPFD